jgi:DNA-binding CsgD family transcriptional regulator
MVRPETMTRNVDILPSPLRSVPEPAGLVDALERHGRIGTWRWVADSEEMEWSDNLYRLLGFEPGERPASVELSMERLALGDVELLRAVLERAPREGPSQVTNYRVVLPDGRLRLLEARPDGGWRLDGSGRRILAGTIRDITEELAAARARAWHRALAELSGDAHRTDPGGHDHLLQKLGLALGTTAGALWVPRGEILEPVAVWSGADLSRDVLARALGAIEPRLGIGTAGAAWERGEVFVANARQSRPEECRLLPGGVRPIVAVPARRGRDVSAVVIFYGAHCLEGAELLEDDLEASRSVLAERLRLAPRSPLTARELEVLALAADGLGGQEIESRLLLSRSTVKSHFENIYGKLGVSNRPGAVARALRDGLIA